MANAERQMPGHVEAAIFVISAQYFSRTDFARNALSIVAIATFLIHCYIMFVFQRAIDKFRSRLYWIYMTYFNGEEQAGLDLPLRPQSSWSQMEVTVGLVLVSFVGLVLTAIFLWSV